MAATQIHFDGRHHFAGGHCMMCGVFMVCFVSFLFVGWGLFLVFRRKRERVNIMCRCVLPFCSTTLSRSRRVLHRSILHALKHTARSVNTQPTLCASLVLRAQSPLNMRAKILGNTTHAQTRRICGSYDSRNTHQTQQKQHTHAHK